MYNKNQDKEDAVTILGTIIGGVIRVGILIWFMLCFSNMAASLEKIANYLHVIQHDTHMAFMMRCDKNGKELRPIDKARNTSGIQTADY